MEIFGYSDAASPDGVTERLRGLADCWRPTSGLSDEDLALRIRADRIDILVDLMLHLAPNRLAVFARRPAPVQVSWLGYPGGTGLSAIGWRLTDPWLDPPDLPADSVERPVRLPDTFWCYDPLTEVPVGELPSLRTGRVTFGCLNNFSKVNGSVLDLWSRVLRALPECRLVLLAPSGESRVRVLRNLGVEPERIDFVDFQPRERYLRTYDRIDLCLDTFPYNGHTTSLDATWMGVPVVTLAGGTAVSRAGLSQASNLGLPEMVCLSPDAFVSRAVSLASDLPARKAPRRAPLPDGVIAAHGRGPVQPRGRGCLSGDVEGVGSLRLGVPEVEVPHDGGGRAAASLTAWTTRLGPRTASPPAKTPGRVRHLVRVDRGPPQSFRRQMGEVAPGGEGHRLESVGHDDHVRGHAEFRARDRDGAACGPRRPAPRAPSARTGRRTVAGGVAPERDRVCQELEPGPSSRAFSVLLAASRHVRQVSPVQADGLDGARRRAVRRQSIAVSPAAEDRRRAFTSTGARSSGRAGRSARPGRGAPADARSSAPGTSSGFPCWRADAEEDRVESGSSSASDISQPTRIPSRNRRPGAAGLSAGPRPLLELEGRIPLTRSPPDRFCLEDRDQLPSCANSSAQAIPPGPDPTIATRNPLGAGTAPPAPAEA